MAANKFATMLHRNTNKITLILIYAFLEWVLILLLLLNSLFSYLITKFAEFFGLKPPCPVCTRLDHIFDHDKVNKKLKNLDHLCEAHNKEISQLSYCSNHKTTVESHEMCEDCLVSAKNLESGKFQNLKHGVFDKANVVSLSCSCCGVTLNYSSNNDDDDDDDDNNDNNNNNNNNNNKDEYSSYVLIKTSSWDVLDSGETENLIMKARNYEDGGTHNQNVSILSCNEKVYEENVSSVGNEMNEMKNAEKTETLITTDESVQVLVDGGSPKHLEYFLDYNGHGLVPFELIDPAAEEYKSIDNVQMRDEDKFENRELCLEDVEKHEVVMKSGDGLMQLDALLDFDVKVSELESVEIEDGNSLVFHGQDCRLVEEKFEQFTMFPLAHFSSKDTIEAQQMEEGNSEEKNSYVHTANEDAALMASNESEGDVSIGTEIPDLDVADEKQIQEYTRSYECTNEDHGPIDEQTVELQSLSVPQNEHPIENHYSCQLDLDEAEEDKASDTPTSNSDSFNQLHKKLLLLEKRDYVAEESFDGGSGTSELEGGEGVDTIDHLKSALRSEQKALQVLYMELEEERSASAVAANQTMAMINRLQEEKAAMQMEALQYQRMMEEQSEYDQEAMQLLNELMVKREKEKQELEKELQVYRKKLFNYESREKMRRLGKSKDGSTRCGFSSTSCSNGEDSDGLSIDLNQDAKEEEGFYSHEDYSDHSTPVDAVFKLEESLADFEEERLSILEHLKGLEEKLMTVEDERDEEKCFEDVMSVAENRDHVIEYGHLNGEANVYVNGFSSETNDKHYYKRKSAGKKGKSLLPLFDAMSDDSEEMMISNGNGNANGYAINGVNHLCESKFDTESKTCAIEDEVDHLYERLQALKADIEFLKHCISSMKQGDKGMDLLQEILQHLRDLRNVELRARNLGENSTM